MSTKKRIKADELREARDRIRVLEGYIQAIETDAAFPDSVDSQLAYHASRVSFHQQRIDEIRERSRPKPERLAELKAALAKSKRRVSELYHKKEIDRITIMAQELSRLEAEFAEMDDSDDDDDADADDSGDE